MRKPASQLRPRLDDLPTPELVRQGVALLSARDYKGAIDIYKLLLKREPQASWREPLAVAYLERARQLAQKEMYRESAVLWENIPSLCGQAPQPDQYVDWLLRSSQYAKAMRAYNDYAVGLSTAEAGKLETLLAALALAGQKDVIQAIPLDAPLRQSLSAAQAALRAYGQGDAEAVVRERLQTIPIRSPYRDLRQALTALLKLESDPTGAPALVERIAPTSPYYNLAAMVRAGAAGEPAQALLTLEPAQRELAGGLLGLGSQQNKLLKDWARLGEKSSDKATFDFIAAHPAAFDRESARHACLLLLPAYPQGLKSYAHLFGPLPPFEAQRLQALRAERAGDISGALRSWRGCADLLIKDVGNPDHRLMAALVLRHMAQLAQQDDDLDWDETPKTLAYLEESLRFDPDDRDSYLKLAALNREAGDDKEYHQWVDRAAKQFPDDAQALLDAAVTATARKAHKKAAGFAARVLELDPINSKARSILINAHLAHARKQILAGKYALAEKELDSASQLERDNARSGVVEINRGLLAFKQHQRERGQQLLREGARLAGNPLLAWLRLAVEAPRLKLEPADFQRNLALGDPRKLTIERADLLALTRLINAYREDEVSNLGSALEDLEKPLQRAIKTLSSEDDLLLICECLHQAPHYELLESAATRALEVQPERPLFVYHQIYGRGEGNIYKVKRRDCQRLEDAMETARDAEDHRTTMRIGQFLGMGRLPFARPRSGPRPMPSMPSGMPRELEEMRSTLDQLPPALRDRMLNQILDDLPPDDDFPPEVQRALMKALLLGDERLEELLDDLPDFPPSSSRRGGRRNRRS